MGRCVHTNITVVATGNLSKIPQENWFWLNRTSQFSEETSVSIKVEGIVLDTLDQSYVKKIQTLYHFQQEGNKMVGGVIWNLWRQKSSLLTMKVDEVLMEMQ